MIETYYENKLRINIQKLGHGVRCIKFESPGFSGVPDRMILLPGARVIFVELKRPGKTERTRQVYVQRLLKSLGFEVFSAVNSDEKIEAVVTRCAEVLRDEGYSGI